MPDATTGTGELSTAPPEHPALDYAFLRREGIRYLESLIGHAWSDFNAHDPGITILEQLCYAITDLAYRASYEVPDLLASGGEDPYRSLPRASAILPSDPVTLLDLRKLVIDVDGVHNAWIEQVTESARVLQFRDEQARARVSGRSAVHAAGRLQGAVPRPGRDVRSPGPAGRRGSA